jgi:hypothetical protein
METGLCDRIALYCSKSAQRGLFTRANGVDASRCPNDSNQADDQNDCQANATTSESLCNATDAVAGSADYLFKIHFRLPGAATGLMHICIFLLLILLFMALAN